ncbi:MAG: DUF4831 family protein [Prevotella sp.]|nr:DUF4831 family protein [Prevotella sp.]
MKHILTIATLALTLSCFSLSVNTAKAQTSTSTYQPGVTQEGATYFLPKTAIRIAVTVEKTVYTPGDFAPYAERFLRLNNVSTQPSTTYRIVSVKQTAIGVRDTSKAYSVKFNNKTSAINLALADDGVILAVNAQPVPLILPTPFQPAQKPATVNPRQFMNEEILAAGSTAKMAQLTAQEIYDLRDSRSQLIKGQADFMPKDGEQLKMMLSQIDRQDQALTSLFAGTTVRDTTEELFIVRPGEELQKLPLFRFSKRFGLVDADDLSGTPFYINIQNLTQLPASDAEQGAKKKKAENGLYYNVAGKMQATILDGNTVVSKDEFPAAQFGYVELLSGDLFNKHYATKLWLNPVSGGIDRIEAEQPK